LEIDAEDPDGEGGEAEPPEEPDEEEDKAETEEDIEEDIDADVAEGVETAADGKPEYCPMSSSSEDSSGASSYAGGINHFCQSRRSLIALLFNLRSPDLRIDLAMRSGSGCPPVSFTSRLNGAKISRGT